jgi:hypothetical protein
VFVLCGSPHIAFVTVGHKFSNDVARLFFIACMLTLRRAQALGVNTELGPRTQCLAEISQ